MIFHYPPCNIFALNTGKYRPRCIFCVHQRPGTMDNEFEQLPVLQQYLVKYVT